MVIFEHVHNCEKNDSGRITMISNGIHTITGAFGYSGKYIAQRLLASGARVRTITNSTQRHNPFGNKIEVYPFNFEDPDKLVESLKGCEVLYNTYWVRFNHSLFNHASAVSNTIKLFEAAKKAGVQKIVHVSITNPDPKSDLEYFNGKGILEEKLKDSGISYSILRPTVLFGEEDILINNIAYLLRTFPIFPIAGDGKYKLQPIYVDDLARIAVEEGANRENKIINAIGPETYTFEELVVTIGDAIGKKPNLLHWPTMLVYFGGWMIGQMKGDILMTYPEFEGLMRDLLYVTTPSPGKISLKKWLKENSNKVGIRYASEVGRRKDRTMAYI
jgi:NADH dehydrogenase